MEKDIRNKAFVVNTVVIYFRVKVEFEQKKIRSSLNPIPSTNKLYPNSQMILEFRSKPYTENSLPYSKRRLLYPMKLLISASIPILPHMVPLFLFSMPHSLGRRVQIPSGDSW